MRMPWGKYNGEDLADIPRNYLTWLLEQEWIDKHPNLVDAIDEELTIRDRSHIDF